MTEADLDWMEEILRYKRDATLLAFGIEVILPPEVVFPTLWVEHFEPKASEEGLRENLDLVEELRAEAHLCTLMYQKAIA
ncbi:hypothetical protein BHE74_00059877 [Ensete ventricosum]|nr:hypothetical protein BHE74_00059877 [Ensete ventricosum]